MSERVTDVKTLEEISRRLRVKVVKMIGKSGFGHAGGSMSIAEILTVLYFYELRIDPKNPAWEERDRFVLSKGHAAPVFYAVLSERGFIPEDVLLTIHRPKSPLQCHPDMKLCPGVEISTGALGQGLSVAVGMALGGKMKGKGFRVYALLGDGEVQEGQVWEAAMSASKFKLDNLVAIVDYNKLELSGKIEEVMPLEPLYDKWVSFGWHTLQINGHSFIQLMNALDEARRVKEKPTAIIAHTVKGRGVSFMEDKVEWHAVTMTEKQVKDALEELGCTEDEINLALSRMKEG